MTTEGEISPARAALEQGIVTIDVVSDVVCPWCYVGKRRLEEAVAATDCAIELHWRPFQLDPDIPSVGLERLSYMATKFGSMKKVDAAHARLEAMGREVGLDFRFERIVRAPNTLDAHRLIRWAATTSVQGAVVEALFDAYFVQGRDIGDIKVLLDIAGRCGMDENHMHRLLVSGMDREAVREEIATAVRLGVSGVPFFIFAGRFAVPGAQPSSVLAAAIAQARTFQPGAAAQ